MNEKIKVGIIYGGKSAEHEVSLESAKSIISAIDKEKYDITPILVDKSGKWSLDGGQHVVLVPQGNGGLINLDTQQSEGKLDVAFPILHGPFGEDGTMQGLLKLANIPFVGASVLGSAVGMDKDVMKRLLRDAGIPIAHFMTITEKTIPTYEEVVKEFGSLVFVKPANLGSSVGVNKASDQLSFEKAIHEAFQYDRKSIIEEYVEGREMECSVLGNDDPIASVPGEVIPTHDFYSYDAKYVDEHGATFDIPAKVSDEVTKKIQDLAIQTYKTLCCEGMARVDFFLKSDGEVIVNEINTIPGFTPISMYPKMWEASKISSTQLIDQLIQLAFDRFEKEKKLITSYEA
ncbi:MAG: D-alanine--D-alanine ligase family protein [Patescibacteria group bacterium]